MKLTGAFALLAATAAATTIGLATCTAVETSTFKPFQQVRLESHGFVVVMPTRGFARLCFRRDE